jgi:hypothetical protein
MQVPVGVVSIEDFGRISRLLERRERVRVTVQLETAITGEPSAPFEEARIPSPLFLQDPLHLPARTLHTSANTADHLIPEDLRQAAVVGDDALHGDAR